MEHFQPGPLLMVDGRICTKEWKQHIRRGGKWEDRSSLPSMQAHHFQVQYPKKKPKHIRAEQEKAALEAKQYTTVTVKLPIKAVNDILKKGPDEACAVSLRDVAAAIHREDAPVSVPAKVGKTFHIVVIYPGPKQLEKRTFSVGSQDTMHNLAVACEAALGIPADNQILNTTCGNGEEITYHAKEPCMLGTFQSMGRLLEGHIIWLSDDLEERKPVPEAMFEEYLDQNSPESALNGESTSTGEKLLDGEEILDREGALYRGV